MTRMAEYGLEKLESVVAPSTSQGRKQEADE